MRPAKASTSPSEPTGPEAVAAAPAAPSAPEAAAALAALAADLERIAVGAVGLTTLALERASPGVDLTFPQWRAILVLGESEDGARISDVAARVGVTLPATGRLLRRLERRGLVMLARDPSDRRATRARLTGHGRDVRTAILEHRRGALREMVGRLGLARDPAVRGALAALAAAFGPYR